LDSDQALGVVIRERPQQNSIENAEDRCIRPDSQRQNADHRGAESRLAYQSAEGVPEFSHRDGA
jgi:hypothetical protein